MSNSWTTLDIFLVDDLSTDGTFQAISQNFPKANIFQSKGNLYWGGGMLKAWKEALKYDYDAYIWVNDDNELYPDALKEVLECAQKTDFKSIICGCFCSKKTGNFTYGGLDKKHKQVIPNGKLQKVNYINGNFVLVPRSVVHKIGLLDPKFIHIRGDFDYGLTAIENGIDIYTTTKYVGISERNPIGNSRGRFLGRSLRQRFKDLFNSPFLDNPNAAFYFNRKHHYNLFYCCSSYLKSLVMILLPDVVYKKAASQYRKHEA